MPAASNRRGTKWRVYQGDCSLVLQWRRRLSFASTRRFYESIPSFVTANTCSFLWNTKHDHRWIAIELDKMLTNTFFEFNSYKLCIKGLAGCRTVCTKRINKITKHNGFRRVVIRCSTAKWTVTVHYDSRMRVRCFQSRLNVVERRTLCSF